MAKLVDPDSLTAAVNATATTEEVEIQTAAKTIQLIDQGNLDDNTPPNATGTGKDSGVTGKCLYSFLKEEWRTNTTLNKFKFPIKMIYEASFQLVNGWTFTDQQSIDLIRDAGFQDTTNNDQYACIISLGAMDDDENDLAYYQQVQGFDQTTANMDKTGELNENIKIYEDGSYDYTDYLKVFLREYAKSYAEYDLLTEQGLAALTYQAYRLPLSNGADLKVADDDATVGGSNDPYQTMTIDYLVGNLFETAAAQSYSIDDVVQDGAGRWARCTTGGTVSTPGGAYGSFGGTSVWEAYPGEREIGGTYYAFNRIIDGNNGTADATKEEVHTFAQYKLRQTGDINDDVNGDAFGTVYGNVARSLTYFVGDQLHTRPGVFVDNLNVNDNNNITYWDITVDGGGLDADYVPVTSTSRNNPYYASFNLNFSANLVGETDSDTLFRVYFTNDDAGDDNGDDFDTINAIVVNDKDGTPIQGEITSGTLAFQYDYSGNVQRGAASAGEDAPITVVFQGLWDAEWSSAQFTIQQATGQNFACNSPDDLNYDNPT